MSDTVVKWLNDNGIKITKKLADAMAAFEFHNCGTIDDLASDFIGELVKFTKEALEHPEYFPRNTQDKTAVIVRLVYERLASHDLQAAVYDLEDRLHTIQRLDEIDSLMIETVNCAVTAYDISGI